MAPGTVVVRAAAATYVDGLDVATVAAGQTANVNFTMSAVASSTALALMSTTATSVDATNAPAARGAEVDFPAGSVLDAAGNPVVTANVDVTTGLPTDANYSESFPGLFIGDDMAIESFGFVTVDITSGGGACTLGPAGADIAIPVDPAADPGTPTIPLWSLDETTGKWVSEGLATRDATGVPVVYRAHVTHFSTYNLDSPIQDAIPLTVTVKDGELNRSGASVVVVSTSAAGAVWEGRGITGADGTYRFPEIPQGTVQVTVNYGDLDGRGYGYDVAGGEATMTVTLVRLLSKVITFVRMVGDVETPVAGAGVQAGAEGGGGFIPFNGTTAADGTVTIQLPSGAGFYMVGANATIGADTWYGDAQAETLAGLPSKITMTIGGAQ